MPSPSEGRQTEQSTIFENVKLNDSLSRELKPILYTPEVCRKTSQNPSTMTLLNSSSHTADFQSTGSNANSDSSLKILQEVDDNPPNSSKETKQEDLDSMFTICQDQSTLTSKVPEQKPLSSNNILQRYR